MKYTSTYPNIYGILLAFFLMSCLSCKQSTPDYIEPDSAFSAYINAYTSGEISKTADIIIRFNDAAIGTQDIGDPLASGILNFSPKLAGTAVWEDERTLKFTPDNALPSGKMINAKAQLDQLFDDVPRHLQTFEFNFSTRQQAFNLAFEGLAPMDSNTPNLQKIQGTVQTADAAEAQNIEQLLTFTQKNNDNLDITWQHDDDQLKHQFSINNVRRFDSSSEVLINWNGKAIGVAEKGKRNIIIPALGDFSLTDVRINRGKNKYIKLSFSDFLKANQNLDGLISIQGYTGEIKTIQSRNEIRIYPAEGISGEQVVKIEASIKNQAGKRLTNPGEWSMTFEQEKPQVRLLGKGTIIPNAEGLIFPFEAVSINAVDVEIFKIFSNNVLQFLQNNTLSGEYSLQQVGRVVYQQKVLLNTLDNQAARGAWHRYALDLSKFIERDPDAIYQVRIGFKQSYATYQCENNTNSTNNAQVVNMNRPQALGENDNINSIMTYRYDWDYKGYRWQHRRDPCYPPYYGPENFVQRNVISSNLGLIAKQGKNGDTYIIVTNLLTAKPESDVQLQVFDYQQQSLGKIKTNADGIAMLNSPRPAFAIIAQKGKERGYLKLQDGASLSLSRFDVGGEQVQKGLKGYLYGERGVWRPGDSIYLNFILEDKGKTLPETHPVTFELYDPKGQLQEKKTTTQHTGSIYNFHTKTTQDAPTGNWRAKVQVGGATFTKILKIETIKPNRLKINLDFGEDEITTTNGKLNGNLQVNWLHGTPAKNLKAIVETEVKSVNTSFKQYPEFEFDDPARELTAEPQVVFDGKLDKNGFAKITTSIESNEAPGRLIAKFKTRAFEKGGDFSTDNFSLKYNPYDRYVGVRIPKNQYGMKRLDLEKMQNIEAVLVDKNGQTQANRSLSVGFYKLEWRWWWSRTRGSLTAFNSNSHTAAIDRKNITTNSKGIAKIPIKPTEWGRYLIRICDEDGHCTGDIFYTGSPWNNGDEMDEEARRAASMLAFSADKEKYNVGEPIKINIPTSEAGRILISIENGSKVLESHWINAKKGETTYKFYASEAMVPTAYLNVSHLQAHGQANNDLPIRMYGVIPIKVEDPNTHLTPLVDLPEELQPEQQFEVKVSEKDGQPMAYTLAIVDDGLLDLTRFKTPSPWSSFYAREAIGVKTWDMYDEVLGAYGGELERILSIGGDDAAAVVGAQKANRFKPVVRHIGPFYLKKNETTTHQITMPNYVGSVRVMVVAANGVAYGSNERTIPVKKPLMILATLPRTLSPGESLKLPVNVFAMDKKVRDVTLKVTSNGLVDLPNGDTQNMTFGSVGDKVAYFNLTVPERIGIAKVKITATGGGETSTQEIELDVRNPNPYVTEVQENIVEAGGKWAADLAPIGMYGTNSATLEISNIPPLNLAKRLRYLIRYPHGCIEQTTSSVFPQLYVGRFTELENEQKNEIERNIKAGLERLKKFQTSSGGFGYWQGESEASEWGANYAGHFMLEARELGYNLPVGMLKKWKKHQQRAARNWSAPSRQTGFNDHGNYNHFDLMQAYRLYTLAIAGAPEMGAMNRMRESVQLSEQGAWRLAAAYAAAGKPEVAKQIIEGLPTNIKPYQELAHTYGSGLRDEAMILETLVLMEDKMKAANQLNNICKQLATQDWHSTQTTAYCLLAAGKAIDNAGAAADNIQVNYTLDSEQKTVNSSNPIVQIPIDIDRLNDQKISMENKSSGTLYARILLEGKPLQDEGKATENNLKMSIAYETLKGKPLYPTTLTQGTDFVAIVTVKNPGLRGNYEEMALSQVFPAGWEIRNARMDGIEGYTFRNDNFEYQDIRDDRIYTYFDVRRNSARTYSVLLNAAYEGRYYLPSIYCEAMYDNTINAREKSGWVEIVKADEES